MTHETGCSEVADRLQALARSKGYRDAVVEITTRRCVQGSTYGVAVWPRQHLTGQMRGREEQWDASLGAAAARVLNNLNWT